MRVIGLLALVVVAVGCGSAITGPPPTAKAVFYNSCDAAREAGVAPLHSGEPGYRKALDADGDGVACS